MVDHYTVKIAPAVPHSEALKKLDEMKEYDPEQMAEWPILWFLPGRASPTDNTIAKGRHGVAIPGWRVPRL